MFDEDIDIQQEAQSLQEPTKEARIKQFCVVDGMIFIL
jgi:hypothetical protein